MNRAELREYARFLALEQGLEWLPDTSSSVYDLNSALMRGYERYAKATRCFRTDVLTASAVKDQALYAYSDFGSSNAGSRIFRLTYVSYDGEPVDPASEARLPRNYRMMDSGTPCGWIPWGGRKLRMIPAPDDTKLIGIEGYETPDPTTFAVDNDIPDIEIDDHEMLAIWAVILMTTANPSDENQLRAHVLYPTWDNRTQETRSNIQECRGPIEVGRYAGLDRPRRLQASSTIERVS